MTANPFRHICADCLASWPDGQTACWSCGSTRVADNPAYRQPIQRGHRSPSPARMTGPAPISNTPYLIGAVGIGLLFGLSALATISVAAAALVGLFAAAIAWTVAEVTITRRRTERIEALLADLAAGRQ